MNELKILSFNIKNDNNLDIEKINILAKIIIDNNFDLIGIQELTYKYPNILKDYNFIGKYRLGNILKSTRFNENNNIITNKRIKYKKTIHLPWLFMSFKDFIKGLKNNIIIPRITTIAILDDNICMINTHLSSSRTPSIQIRQLKKLKKIINKYSKYKIILTGDFNMKMDNPNFKNFVNTIPMLKRININQSTWRSSIIDHIFIPKNWYITDSGIIDTKNISDHNAIYANIKQN